MCPLTPAEGCPAEHCAQIQPVSRRPPGSRAQARTFFCIGDRWPDRIGSGRLGDRGAVLAVGSSGNNFGLLVWTRGDSVTRRFGPPLAEASPRPPKFCLSKT